MKPITSLIVSLCLVATVATAFGSSPTTPQEEESVQTLVQHGKLMNLTGFAKELKKDQPVVIYKIPKDKAFVLTDIELSQTHVDVLERFNGKGKVRMRWIPGRRVGSYQNGFVFRPGSLLMLTVGNEWSSSWLSCYYNLSGYFTDA